MKTISTFSVSFRKGRGIVGLSLLIGLSCCTPSGAEASIARKLVVTLPNQLFLPILGNKGAVASQNAGVPFNIALTAVDALGSIDVLYNGTRTISYSGPGGMPAYSTKVTFFLGQAIGVRTMLTLAETTSITVSDGSLVSDASSSLIVKPGSMAALQLLAPGETAAPGTPAGKAGAVSPEISGGSFIVQVNAVDSYWNLVNSSDRVAITSGDANAVLPASSALSGGKANFSLTLKTPGNQTVAAKDLTAGYSSSPDTIAVSGGQSQSISFSPLSDEVYGAATFGISATASSGLPVSFSVVSGPATVTGANVTITGAGIVTVQASQAGSSNYLAAPNVTQTFNVTPAPLTVSATNASRFVGQANPVMNGTVSGLQYNDSITATFSAAATANSPIGNYPIIPAFADAGHKLANYNVTTNGLLSVNPLAMQWTTANGGNGHYYQAILFPGGISWDQASTYATNAGGYLATITSSDENNFIFGLISNTPDYWIADSGGGDGVWIGGVRLGPLSAPPDPTNWTWVTGEAFVFQNWAYGQPNNVNGYQDHIQFYSPSGLTANTWNDAANMQDEAYIPGYVIEYNSNPYVVSQLRMAISVNESFSRVNVAANGHAFLHFAGVPNRSYSVQASTDLQSWTAIGSITAGADGQFDFEDVDAMSFRKRFYRTAHP